MAMSGMFWVAGYDYVDVGLRGVSLWRMRGVSGVLFHNVESFFRPPESC